MRQAPDTRTKIDAVRVTWEESFRDVSDTELRAAVLTFLNDPEVCRWGWPQPGTLRSLIPRMLETELLDPDAAWGELIQSWSRYGTGPGEFRNKLLAQDDPDDPLYGVAWDWSGDEVTQKAKQAALDAIGGMSHLAQAETWNQNNEGQLRAAFRNAFRGIQRQARAGPALELAKGGVVKSFPKPGEPSKR